MVNTLTWVLLGVLVYWVAVAFLDREGYLPDYVGTQGPLTTLHTKRGRAFIEWLSTPKRFWRAWANVGVGVALVVMVGAFLVLLQSAASTLQHPVQTAVNQPRNVLVIPGVNDFLPLAAAPEILFGLLVGLVVHEGGHGLLCRVEDIEIASMGVALFTILPIGAFVEPNEEERAKASRGAQIRMFAAGVTNNFAITIVAFALLFGPVIASIGVAPGVAVQGVFPNSPAANAHIGGGDRITALDGHPVANASAFDRRLASNDNRTVSVAVNGERTRTVERSLLVTATVPNGPAPIPKGATITTVNGTPVYTSAGFQRAIENSSGVVTVTAKRPDSSKTDRYTFAAGAYVTVIDGRPLADAGAPAGKTLVVTRFAGERIASVDQLSSAIDAHDPGDTVTVVGYRDGQRVRYNVTLGKQGGSAFLGIQWTPGVTGLEVSDFGIQPYPADRYLAVLGGPSANAGVSSLVESFVGKVFIVLLLPIAGLVFGAALPYNFAGFTPNVTNFYVPQGPLGFLGGGVFVLANLLFWTGWVNVQLGFFNCIPAYPLDGGHILRISTETILSRLPIRATRRLVRLVTTTIGVTMLLSFLVMVFGPTLLS